MNERGIEIRSDKFGHHKAWKPYRLVKNAEEANDRPYKCALSAISRSSRKILTHSTFRTGTSFSRAPRLLLLVERATHSSLLRRYIIVTTKAPPDLLPTASILAPFLESNLNQSIDLEDGPTVCLIQNGIGIEHGLQCSYPHVPIISTIAWIGANLHPGPLVTMGIMEKLIMGQ